jgi:alcohol dehydrogenase, propanol-preferring
MIADARYAFPLGESGSDVEMAPLLCAGLIGWRSLQMAGAGRRLGLYGFGAAAHIVAQVAKWQHRSVFAFTRPGDLTGQTFARTLGAVWDQMTCRLSRSMPGSFSLRLVILRRRR